MLLRCGKLKGEVEKSILVPFDVALQEAYKLLCRSHFLASIGE